MAILSKCSDGTEVSQDQINTRYKKARESKYAGVFGTLPCEACGAPSNDNDHTIAQARCKEIHKTELIWNPDNFPRSCRKCHMEWESFKDGAWLNHWNVVQRLTFMMLHDPEGYRIRTELTRLSLYEKENSTQKKAIQSGLDMESSGRDQTESKEPPHYQG